MALSVVSFFFHFLFLYTFIRPSLFTGPLSEVISFLFGININASTGGRAD